MNERKGIRALALVVGFVTVLVLTPRAALAHCDTLAGPVVQTARIALEKGDVTPVLKWVSKENEAGIREAFQKTLVVRAKGAEAKDLADMYFFETLVRIHRAGEGAPYTGLKPANQVEPVVAAADQALEAGSVEALEKDVTEAVRHGIRERFGHAVEAKKHADESVEAGREFVAAYVIFMHYVEGLHQAALAKTAHHGEGEEHPNEGGHKE